MVEVIGVELHRLRRDQIPATLITRGGYVYEQVPIHTVHRHHAVLNGGDRPGVLVPLAFIESVQHLP